MATADLLDALIAGIDDHPDDHDRYLVLADALIAADDPRGELIVVQHRLQQHPNDHELRRAEAACLADAWSTELTPFRRTFWNVVWRLGFLDELNIEILDVVKRGSETDLAPLASEIFRTVSTAPIARWLRKLSLGMPNRQFLGDSSPLLDLSNLRSLRIVDGGGLGDHELHAFASMPRLESLALGHCTLSAAAVESIPNTTKLRELRFVGLDEFSDEHLAATAKLDWLHSLRIQGGIITDKGVARASDSIRELAIIYSPAITNDVIRQLGDRPLDALTLLSFEPFAGADLVHLPGALKRLCVDKISEVGSALKVIAQRQGSELREIELSGELKDRLRAVTINASDLARVMELPNLRRLKFRGYGSLVDDANHLASHSAIEELEFGIGAVPPKWITQLARLPLKMLNLIAFLPNINAWVDDEVLAQLADLEHLTKLRLRQTAITDAGLERLSRLRNLVTLDVSQCEGITSRGLASLAALSNLAVLDVSWCQGIDSVAALAGHVGITKLDIAGSPINDDAMTAIASFPSLRALLLKATALTDAGIAALLPRASTLAQLELSQCSAITPRSVAVLRQFHRLERLGLKETQIGEAGIAELIEALPTCTVSH